ncbi:hypothetical protein ACPV5J_07410 [Vibrio rotiferianus]|uniref:hypothetical protein n=1 Tax=Vibrio rotiferianus TaxID=190895 RepID=UPI00406A200D
MEQPIFDPIHLPCPDMAGCANPNPELTVKSRENVAQALEWLRSKKAPAPQRHIPSRFAFAKREA